MNDVLASPAVSSYLSRLDRALAVLPRARRDEIVGEIVEHIEDAHAELPADHRDADLRNVLERLGEPEQIAREACARFGVRPAAPSWVEYVALVLITAGSLLLPLVGWLAGIVLVWLSKVWRTREKVLATVIFPFGFAPALFLGFFAAGWAAVETCVVSDGVTQCTSEASSVGTVVVAAFLLLSTVGVLAVAVYLAMRLRRAGRSALG